MSANDILILVAAIAGFAIFFYAAIRIGKDNITDELSK